MQPSSELQRTLFEALTSKQVSRNKNYVLLGKGWQKTVWKRYLLVRTIAKEAEDLLNNAATRVRVVQKAQTESYPVVFFLSNAQRHYQRESHLLPHEWEWLQQQAGVKALLKAQPLHPIEEIPSDAI